jgi:hypothetical protein
MELKNNYDYWIWKGVEGSSHDPFYGTVLALKQIWWSEDNKLTFCPEAHMFQSGRSSTHFSMLSSLPMTKSKPHLYEAIQTPTMILISVSYRPCMWDIISTVILSLGAKWKPAHWMLPSYMWNPEDYLLSSGTWWHLVCLMFTIHEHLF